MGIALALVLRGIFILTGAAILERFTWVFFLFGAFLIYTAIKLAMREDDDEEYKENALISFMRKIVKMSDQYDGKKMTTMVNGVRHFTPIIVLFVAIGTTDVMFAFDSIPAIFGLTKDPLLFLPLMFSLCSDCSNCTSS